MGAVLAHSSLGAWAAAVIALTIAHKPARVRADSTRRECPRRRRGRRSRPVWVAVHAVGAVGAHWKLKAGTAIVVARSRTECRGRGRHFSPVKDCCGRILGAQAQDGSNEQEVEEEAPASHCFEADFGEGEAGRRPVRRAAPVCVFRRVLFGRPRDLDGQGAWERWGKARWLITTRRSARRARATGAAHIGAGV